MLLQQPNSNWISDLQTQNIKIPGNLKIQKFRTKENKTPFYAQDFDFLTKAYCEIKKFRARTHTHWHWRVQTDIGRERQVLRFSES